MILNAGGSAKHYHDQQVGLGLTKIPSQDVMKQVMSEYMHVDMTSTNWLTNFLYQHDTTKALQLDSKWIKGYIHDLEICDQFSMTLHTELQFKAYKKIPSSRRILHMDATGNMISIPNTMRKYNRILTYALIAQDIDKLSNTHREESNYLLLSETSTSSHDTHQLSKMLLNAKICFKSLYPNETFCYMLVLDLSWASIHAACNELNNEDFID
jgi:hypothetical protein